MGRRPGISAIRRSRSPWAHFAPTLALLLAQIHPTSADDPPSTTASDDNQTAESQSAGTDR